MITITKLLKNLNSFSMEKTQEELKIEETINLKSTDYISTKKKLTNQIWKTICNNAEANQEKQKQLNYLENQLKSLKSLLLIFYEDEFKLESVKNSKDIKNIDLNLEFYKKQYIYFINLNSKFKDDLKDIKLRSLFKDFFYEYLKEFLLYLYDQQIKFQNLKIDLEEVAENQERFSNNKNSVGLNENFIILLILIILFAYIGFEFYLIYRNLY